jgi:hypothetical protein
MKKFLKLFAAAAAIGFGGAGIVPSAFGQATTQVLPRQYALLSSALFTNTQTLGTNAALPSPGLGYTNVGVFTNTFIPFNGSHAIGLVAQIVNTNVFAAASNLTITVYPAYDTGGLTSGSLNARYGTNFCPTPLLTWTISYKTNQVAWTNLPSSLWEPATSLGYTIANGGTATTGGAPSNILVTLTQTVAP